MQDLVSLYQFQIGELQRQSPLVDNQKIYNTLSEMVKTVGREAVNEYFNNPEMPDQMVLAERDMLKQMVQQMEAQMQNPLAEAAQVEAEGAMQREQMKQKYEAQLKMLDMEQSFNDKLRDAKQQSEQQIKELEFKYTQLLANTKLGYTELELKHSKDVPNEGMEKPDVN